MATRTIENKSSTHRVNQSLRAGCFRSGPVSLFDLRYSKMEATRICPKCQQSKSASEFYKARIKKDGLSSYCKSCQRIYQRSAKAKAARKGREKLYRQTEKGKAVQRKKREKYEKTEKGKATKRARQKRYYARHPNQLKAESAVNHAVQADKLPRPDTLLCHYCPKPAQQYHHWHGYEPEHWLDVVSACIPCHQKCKRKIA